MLEACKSTTVEIGKRAKASEVPRLGDRQMWGWGIPAASVEIGKRAKASEVPRLGDRQMWGEFLLLDRLLELRLEVCSVKELRFEVLGSHGFQAAGLVLPAGEERSLGEGG
ncbi:hypothetical protein B296_00053171 [Ensete ventricosum]|uniref:Uncharacterized protein n=1 Tax=Ensete ventricosum TaxID=4639 RepID=A0A426XBA7_ENSVE|nr:hypothetical protein B296_00053171 [Ensete ventricosum]